MLPRTGFYFDYVKLAGTVPATGVKALKLHFKEEGVRLIGFLQKTASAITDIKLVGALQEEQEGAAGRWRAYSVNLSKLADQILLINDEIPKATDYYIQAETEDGNAEASWSIIAVVERPILI